jgi:hypothetical protein
MIPTIVDSFEDERKDNDELIFMRNYLVMDEKIEDISQSITYYESQQTYKANMNIVLQTLKDQNKSLIDNMQQSTVPTNNRKTYYLQMEQSTINAWVTSFNIFILSSVALLLSHQPIEWVFVGFLLTSVFILPTIVNLVKKMPYGVNVYTEWGYDPNAKKSQFLYIIPIVCVVLFIFVMKAFPQ